MPLIDYTPEEYLHQFQRLLPRGRVWHRGWGRIQAADLLTLMPTWARLHARLNDLIEQIFPCSTVELLPEWEATLGLPDPCVGTVGSLQEQQFLVCTKFVARGGQSKTYFIAVAAALGFTITITEFHPFRAGIEHAGDPVSGEGWAHVWRVTAVSPIVYFRAGRSRAGERLRSWGSLLLECTLKELAPAHTILLFAYTPPAATTAEDAAR